MRLKRLVVWFVGAVAGLSVTGAQATPQPAYISGVGEPYGVNGNLDAMNAAFGSGNWQRLTFSNAVASGAFTPGNYSMLFFDGSDGYDGEFTTFIGDNKSALENYVSGGGHVFLNAARQSGADLDLGFSVTLHFYQDKNASAYDSNHPIFHGPLSPTGTSWNATYFSHDYIVSSNAQTIIKNGIGNPILAQLNYGSGVILFGGMTPSSYHSPGPEALNLRANILSYTNNYVVPEPTSLQMGLMLAFGGFGLLRSKKR